jgi:hypothetical protein
MAVSSLVLRHTWPAVFWSIQLQRGNVTLSHYMPRQSLIVPGFLGFQDSRDMNVATSALRTGRIYPQKIALVPISVRGWGDPRAIVRPEELSQRRVLLIPAGIEPVTFWLVAQCKYGVI